VAKKNDGTILSLMQDSAASGESLFDVRLVRE
jgi:hypothetical protein